MFAYFVGCCKEGLRGGGEGGKEDVLEEKTHFFFIFIFIFIYLFILYIYRNLRGGIKEEKEEKKMRQKHLLPLQLLIIYFKF